MGGRIRVAGRTGRRPLDERHGKRPRHQRGATAALWLRAWCYRRVPRLAFSVRRLARANYERGMDLLDVLCDPARTSIDVGAKDGMYTYRLLDRSRDVVAFEPGPMHAHI